MTVLAFGQKYRVPKDALYKSKYLRNLFTAYHRLIRSSLQLTFVDRFITQVHWERAVRHMCQDENDDFEEYSQDEVEFAKDPTYYAGIVAISSFLQLSVLGSQYLRKTIANVNDSNVLDLAKVFTRVEYDGFNDVVLKAVVDHYILSGTQTELSRWIDIVQTISPEMLKEIFSSNGLYSPSEYKRCQYVYNMYQTLKAQSKQPVDLQEKEQVKHEPKPEDMDPQTAATTAAMPFDWNSPLRVLLAILKENIHYSNMSYSELRSVRDRMDSGSFQRLLNDALWRKCEERFVVYKKKMRIKPPKPLRVSLLLTQQSYVRYLWWAGYVWELHVEPDSARICRVLAGDDTNSCHFDTRNNEIAPTGEESPLCDCSKCRAYSQHKWVLDLYPDVYAQASFFLDYFHPVSVNCIEGSHVSPIGLCKANEPIDLEINSERKSVTLYLQWL